MAESRRGRSYATADCPGCGETGPRFTEDVERARRWAVKHADDNPGHRAHLMTEATRIYETTGADS